MLTFEQKNYLESVARDIIKRAKTNLKNGKGNTKLAGSLDYDLVEVDGSMIVNFKMDDYGTFVDKGVKGKGGTIGEESYGGRRYFTTYEGKRKDSPYQFGTGSGGKGGLTRAISKWIKKKGLKGRVDKNWKSAGNKGGQFISDKSLTFLISRSIYIKGVHGISFFQNAIMNGIKNLNEGYEVAFIEDVQNTIDVSTK